MPGYKNAEIKEYVREVCSIFLVTIVSSALTYIIYVYILHILSENKKYNIASKVPKSNIKIVESS